MSRQADRERVARYVAARRGSLGLSQEQLATKAGVDIKTLWNLETGDRWPQAKTRARIEAALGWDEGDILRLNRGLPLAGEEESELADLEAAIGTEDFDRLALEMLARLPEPERAAARLMFDHYQEMQRSAESVRERLRALFRRHHGDDKGDGGGSGSSGIRVIPGG